MQVTYIEFEDAGQDFLSFLMDSKGHVIHAYPFQSMIWRDYQTIKSPDRYRKGDYLQLLNNENKTIKIKHLIKKVRTIKMENIK